jgi:hypothetical protein
MFFTKIPLLIAAFFLVETCLDTITGFWQRTTAVHSGGVLVMNNSRRVSYRLKQIGGRHERRA